VWPAAHETPVAPLLWGGSSKAVLEFFTFSNEGYFCVYNLKNFEAKVA